MDLVGAEHLRADELSVYDGAAEGVDRTICLADWLKSKCRRAGKLSRQFDIIGLYCVLRLFSSGHFISPSFLIKFARLTYRISMNISDVSNGSNFIQTNAIDL